MLFLTAFIFKHMKRVFQASLVLVAVYAILFTSCDNTPDPGVAEVKVYDENNVAQSGIKVTMYCTEPGCVVRRVGRTNSVGVFTEEFELPVVLRVRAVRYDTTTTTSGLPPNVITRVSVDSLCGEGFVQVENDEITSETITILECN